MRIVVNDIAASEGGAMSILKDFYEEVREFGADHEWIFLLGDYYLEETPNIKVYVYPEIKKSWLKRLNFDFYFGKNIINEFNPDIYLSLQNTATLGIKCCQYVYLHQPLPFQKEKDFSFFKINEIKLAIYQKIIGKIFLYLFRKTRAKIIVQTHWMKDVLSEKVMNSVLVIPPKINVENKSSNRITYKIDEKAKKKFFYPASKETYKNHKIIYEAVDALVNEGCTNFEVVLTIDDIEVNNRQYYQCVGKISRHEVFILYQNSTLLFPSYIETYGLPLIEAKTCNSIIFASNTAFSKEVLGNYNNGYFFNFRSAEELTELMRKKINGDIKQFENQKIDFSNNTLYNFIVTKGIKK
ncbi:glycosyltransferase [Enterococcus faecium]|nr:glycosyltransferase [Enterococcus faecium]